MPVHAREHRDQPRELAPHQRLAAREPHVGHAHPRQHAHQPLDLLEAEHLGAVEPGQAVGRHAVLAAEVAAVRDGDPQVRDQRGRGRPRGVRCSPCGRVSAVDLPLTEIRAPTRGNRKLEALLRGRQRGPAPARLVVHAAGQRGPARHVGPLLGPHPDRREHRAAAVSAAEPRRRGARDGHHARHERPRRRGGDRGRVPVPRHRHVDPPHRPRAVQPLPGRPTGCRCCWRASTRTPS